MKLSQRLILSYILIIMVSLLLAFSTLILTARPLQNRLNDQRLALQAERVKAELSSSDKLSSDQLMPRIANVARRSRSRLLLLDEQSWVLLDTRQLLEGEQLRRFNQPLSMIQEPTGFFEFEPGGDPPLHYILVNSLTLSDQRQVHLVIVDQEFPVITRFISESSWSFVLAAIVATLVSLLLSVLIARSIARPLQEIAEATEALAKGDYQPRLREAGPLEIRQVASSFNLMIEQVAANQQAMRDFVSNVSHELKTPLTSIKGFSQAIAEGATPDITAQQRAATIIYQEAGRLSRLVEDLLDLARLDSGQVMIRQQSLDLMPILTHAMQRMLPQATQKQIKLQYDKVELPQVVGDGDRLAQVFTNLLDNAIRHTPEGGRVTVTTQRQPSLKMLDISVTDTGGGIPADELARVFERFYQVDKSRKRGQGTGLGLAISKEIVEAHGGTIKAESVTGLGTRFVVSLQLNASPATKPRLPQLIKPPQL